MQDTATLFKIAETYNLRSFMLLMIIVIGLILIYLIVTTVYDILKKNRLIRLKKLIEEAHQKWLYASKAGVIIAYAKEKD